jgi:thymidylate kinase
MISKKRKTLSCILTLLALLTQKDVSYAKSVGDSMGDFWNDIGGTYSNSTEAGGYQLQGAGYYTGGNFTARTKVVSVNPVTIVPPGIRAGCGGIDVYTGAFSHINTDQFVALMKAIPSNALGFAFQIALEGSDGSGKGTQTDMLVRALEALGYKVARVSFPRYKDTCGGKLLFEVLKSDRASYYDFLHTSPETASLIYAADRLESVPWLEQLAEENDVIIFDRAVGSNLVHQGGKFKSDDDRRKFLEFIDRIEYQSGFPRPDMTIFLSLPFEISMARAKARAEKMGEKADVVEVDENYMRQSHRSGVFYALECGWTIVDGMQGSKELSPEAIFDALLYQVQKRLPKK